MARFTIVSRIRSTKSEEPTERISSYAIGARARYGLCKIIVRDPIALLLGEGRFPAIDCEDEASGANTLATSYKRKLSRR